MIDSVGGSLRPQADFFLLIALNGSGPTFLGPLMLGLSWLGDYCRVPLYAAGALAIGIRRQRQGDEVKARLWLRAALGMALALPLSAALAAGLKDAFAAPRPSAILDAGTVTVLAEAGSIFSFPSGHATSAGLLAASLWPILPLWGRVIAIVLALAIAISRVWLGVHFPSDVLAGLAIGAAVGAATGELARLLLKDQRT